VQIRVSNRLRLCCSSTDVRILYGPWNRVGRRDRGSRIWGRLVASTPAVKWVNHRLSRAPFDRRRKEKKTAAAGFLQMAVQRREREQAAF